MILIGPINAGKSTVAALLGDALGWPVVVLDDVSHGYYREIGFDEREADRREAAGGFRARYDYWKPFEIHAVERMLADHADRRCVFDFGAGHAVYEDPVLFERARQALAPYSHVVLMLPSPDLEESLRVLTSRVAEDPHVDADSGRTRMVMRDINSHLIGHHSMYDLATRTVYSAGRTPDEVVADILATLTR